MEDIVSFLVDEQLDINANSTEATLKVTTLRAEQMIFEEKCIVIQEDD
ncbi:hypothetical protein [Runella sp.]